MKRLLLIFLISLSALRLCANDKVQISVSTDEISAKDAVLLMIKAEYSEMGADRFVGFKGKKGIKISPAIIQQVSWNKKHIPKGLRIQVHKVELDADTITLTEADFTGLPADFKFTITLKKKKDGA